ncbi:unnamed protein product [Pleuronectes platessa]|uniref:Uncharacterized protein n=1 Tax=Pleuronectes platessa TaxID=8262 RepID=A0A9N7YN22_PLEPL|nr:unnamed protein product [Pleuronectes platessa]
MSAHVTLSVRERVGAAEGRAKGRPPPSGVCVLQAAPWFSTAAPSSPTPIRVRPLTASQLKRLKKEKPRKRERMLPVAEEQGGHEYLTLHHVNHVAAYSVGHPPQTTTPPRPQPMRPASSNL